MGLVSTQLDARSVKQTGQDRCLAPIHNREGFSFVELIIVLLIIGVVAAVATPVFVDSLLFHRVESAARRVKADLELARQTARATSTTQTISFVGLTYTLSAGVADLDKQNEAYVVDLSQPPFELDNVSVDFAGTTSTEFDGYANPSKEGTIVLSAKDHHCTVTLDDTTGNVTITSSHTRGRVARVETELTPTP